MYICTIYITREHRNTGNNNVKPVLSVRYAIFRTIRCIYQLKYVQRRKLYLYVRISLHYYSRVFLQHTCNKQIRRVNVNI